ncbi:MAG: hypothetical protein OEO23_06760, partial [Gemmatimonadota bacterium]|nr:hypothetical protein [Gemmatimonadota bacterium]
WADTLVQPGPAMGRTRGLRGSHLVFPRACLPLRSAVASVHADTGRPVYALPWGPVTLVGSTSIPHTSGPDTEPVISEAEVEYLLRWTQTTFPDRRIDVHDIRSTFSGVRAMAGQPGGKELAHASREEHIGRGPGLVTVIGGKLTTFHSTARRVMSHVRRELGLPRSHSSSQPLDPLPVPWPGLPFSDPEARRLMAFYGPSALEALAGARPADRKPLPGLNVCAAEIRWVCARESVERLGDLMLRRFRWGLTAPLGGLPSIPRLRGIVCPAMGWSATRWQHEVQAYRTYWRHAHAPPSIQGSAPVGESRRRARKQVASA